MIHGRIAAAIPVDPRLLGGTGGRESARAARDNDAPGELIWLSRRGEGRGVARALAKRSTDAEAGLRMELMVRKYGLGSAKEDEQKAKGGKVQG